MGPQRWCFFNESQSVCLSACRGSIWDLASSLFTIKGCRNKLRIHLGEQPLNSAEPSYPSLMEGWQRGQQGGTGQRWKKCEQRFKRKVELFLGKEQPVIKHICYVNGETLIWKFLCESWWRVKAELHCAKAKAKGTPLALSGGDAGCFQLYTCRYMHSPPPLPQSARRVWETWLRAPRGRRWWAKMYYLWRRETFLRNLQLI